MKGVLGHVRPRMCVLSPTAREHLARRRAVDLAAHYIGRVRGDGNRPVGQRRQAVRQHFGSHIHQQVVLAQPADILQAQAVFEPLERCLKVAVARLNGWRLQPQ